MSSESPPAQPAAGSPPATGVRVLDLATRRAEMAGRLLADLGAEVLKIEPPGGAEARRLPPFERDREGDGEASLYWQSVGCGKLSGVLDFDDPGDRSRLRRLARRADVLIESFDPGALDRLELGYRHLEADCPRLVYASIAPFGQEGPKAAWPATELTLEAAGGRIAFQGDPDRPPLPMGLPHTAFHAGAQAAADILVALHERELSGRGQRLDLSMQEAMVWTLMGPVGYPLLTGSDPPSCGDERADTSALPPLARLFPRLCECADGWVTVSMAPVGQSRGGGILPQVMRELRAAGSLSPELGAVDWDRFEEAFKEERLAERLIERAVAEVLAYLKSRSKAELLEWGLRHKHRLAPIRSTSDLLACPHLEARRYFAAVEGRLRPGLPWRFGECPELPATTRAPRLAEHQGRIADWLEEEGGAHRTTVDSVSPDRPGEAFAGLKVADFSWVVAGPTISKALADHGATVVRIESSRRPDLARRLAPYKDGVEGLNRSQWAAMFNTSKLSLALDLSRPHGQQLALRLIAWADVVIESFSPGTMERLGLDPRSVCAERPDLVWMSTSLFGPGGPLSRVVGYGQQAAAFAGLHAVTGWPDRPPCGPFGPYTDVIAPKFGVAVLTAALLERRQWGRGRYIDLSQVECGVRFLEPLMLDQTINGRTATGRGMRSETACPHGVYATRGIERYVAIAVETAEQWRRLLELVPLADFEDPALAELAARLAVRERLEAAMRRWCREQDPWQLERRLVAAGVPASVVQRPSDLYADPQLEHRAFRQTLMHGELGAMPYDGFATRFSSKRRMLHRAAPCLGEHTETVLRDLLEMSDAEIEALRAADVLV